MSNFSARTLLAGLTFAMAGLAQAGPTVIYDSLGPVVQNLPSLGYQATSTSEFGDRIAFDGTARALQEVTVRMSNWALASTYGSNDAGYSHNLTLNIYNAGTGASAGSLLTSKTISAFIPWRPEASADCGTGYMVDSLCYNGLAFDVKFDFSSLGIVLSNSVVIGVAFNTQSYGADPLGVAGAYNSLNVGLSAGTTVGTDVNPDGVFWNTSHQPFLTTGVAGTFGEDTDWRGYVPALQITANELPEPTSLALVGIAAIGVGVARRRARNV